MVGTKLGTILDLLFVARTGHSRAVRPRNLLGMFPRDSPSPLSPVGYGPSCRTRRGAWKREGNGMQSRMQSRPVVSEVAVGTTIADRPPHRSARVLASACTLIADE